MLRDVGDAILRAEKLEEELKKAKQQASNLQIRLDRNAVEYRNEVQVLTAAKDGLVDQNKSLTAQKNEQRSSPELVLIHLYVRRM